MKNTKHTEKNDSSIEQDNQETLSQSKRKILTSIGVTSGVVGASALVPSTWVKPAVNSVILPAHAQSTPPVSTTTIVDGPPTTTMMPPTTTMMPPTTTMMPPTTTMMPPTTTMMPPTTPIPMVDPKILIVSSVTTSEVAEEGEIAYHIRLSEQPNDDVMVTATSVPATAPGLMIVHGDGTNAFLTFTRANYSAEQTVRVTAPEDSMVNPSVTVTFTATGGGFDKASGGSIDVTETDMFTVLENDGLPPMNVGATVGGTFAKPTITVSWDAPDTSATVLGYTVNSDQLVPALTRANPTDREITFTEGVVTATDHVMTVTVLYPTGTTLVTSGAASSTVTVL